MTIDKISGSNGIQPNSNIKKAYSANGAVADRVDISNEAKIASQNEYLLNITRQSPEIRADKVAEGREKLRMYMQDASLKEEAIMSIASSMTDGVFSTED